MKKFVLPNSEKLEKTIDKIGEIAAFCTIIFLLFLFVNAQFGIIKSIAALRVLNMIKTYMVLLTVAITGFEFVADKHIAWIIVFFVIITAVLVLSFFPNVRLVVWQI